MNQQLKSEYARLIVTKGLNLDQGQEVILMAGLDQPAFVRTVVEECYKQGASK
ncbi:MAG: aminopeptidase, partial [Victivallales bacterium]|nr:aminopeptidase [Victivallales bacterium]